MMTWADAIHLALRALTAHRLRSFLTLLGIAVGIAAVILMTSIGEGIHRFVLGEFTQFGTNVITAVPGKTRTGGSPSGLPSIARPTAATRSRLPTSTTKTPTLSACHFERRRRVSFRACLSTTSTPTKAMSP